MVCYPLSLSFTVIIYYCRIHGILPLTFRKIEFYQFKNNMKYLSMKIIEVALHRVLDANCTKEHVTGTPANSLARHYFPLEKYTITPEQTQPFSNRRPDLTIERLDSNDNLVIHCFVELKSLVNSNFNNIMDQLYDTILSSVDFASPNFSVYIIAMKGVNIAFFQFYSYTCLLDEYGIVHYKGFIPLNQLISAREFMGINNTDNLIDYLKYIKKYPMLTNKDKLTELGVESTEKIPFPHIWNLLNKDHENHVHDLFVHMANNIPGTDID